MSEEIKEILDQLKDSIEYPKFEMPTFDGSDFDYVDNDTLLEPDKCKILLDYITYLQQKEDKIKKLQEENLLLRASEPMSKLVDDYGYKAKNEEAIKLIKKWRVNPTSYFENMRGSLIVPKVETDRLLKLLGDMENE